MCHDLTNDEIITFEAKVCLLQKHHGGYTAEHVIICWERYQAVNRGRAEDGSDDPSEPRDRVFPLKLKHLRIGVDDDRIGFEAALDLAFA